MYKCAKCGKPVAVVNGEIKRECDCQSAVIATARAEMAGNGGLR